MWQPGWEGGLGRMDTCTCMAEFLHCSIEAITTLLIGIPQNKMFLVLKILKLKKKKKPANNCSGGNRSSSFKNPDWRPWTLALHSSAT